MLMPQNRQVLEVAPDYHIFIQEPGKYVVITVPVPLASAAARFRHANVQNVKDETLWLRHGKQWSEMAGRKFDFIVPREQIDLDLTHKGYSWPRAVINGVEVFFNVCGGTRLASDGWEGWGDYLTTDMNVCLERDIEVLKAIAAVALPKNEGVEK